MKLVGLLRNSEKWTGHLKFYADITGLKKNVGLAFIAMTSMVEENKLVAKGKNYFF